MINQMVRCPKCGKYRRTSSLNYVKCFFCGKSFDAKKYTVNESSYLKNVNKEVGFK